VSSGRDDSTQFAEMSFARGEPPGACNAPTAFMAVPSLPALGTNP
jgi:hypothetical protein